MIKWHIDQFVDFYVIFSLCLTKYYQIFVRDNKKHDMFKVLNYGCSYPLIDDYIKYKICGPINATSFPIMAFILQLTHGYSKIQKPLNRLSFFATVKDWHLKIPLIYKNTRSKASQMELKCDFQQLQNALYCSH